MALVHATDWTGGGIGSTSSGGAGSTTGAGDAWIDTGGGIATAGSNNRLKLSGRDDFFNTNHYVLRPSGDAVADSRVGAILDGGASCSPYAVHRYQGTDTAILIGFNPLEAEINPGQIQMFANVAGALSALGSPPSAAAPSSPSNQIMMTTWVIGNAPTTLGIEIWDATANVSLARYQTTVTLPSGLSAAGQEGVGCHSSPNGSILSIRSLSVYEDSVAPAPTEPPPTTEIYDEVVGTAEIGGQAVLFLIPNSNSATPYNSAVPTNLVLFSHGAGENQTMIRDDAGKRPVTLALLNAGYIVASSYQHNTNWGSQAGVDDLVGLREMAGRLFNIGKTVVWGQSMGGLSSLSAIAQRKLPGVCGWLGTYPVCSLANLYGIGTYAPQINAAHGITGTGTATYAIRTFGLDPALKHGVDFGGIRFRLYASAADTVVPKTANADALAALVADSSPETVVVVCSGEHGDLSHFDPAGTVAFFGRCVASPPPTSGLVGEGSGTGGAITPDDIAAIAAAILVDPTHKITTDASGRVSVFPSPLLPLTS